MLILHNHKLFCCIQALACFLNLFENSSILHFWFFQGHCISLWAPALDQQLQPRCRRYTLYNTLEVLSLLDFNIKIVCKSKGKSWNPPADLNKSNSIQEVQPSTKETQSYSSRPKQAVVQSSSSTVEIKTTANKSNVKDLSSLSGSEYVPNADKKALMAVTQDESKDMSA